MGINKQQHTAVWYFCRYLSGSPRVTNLILAV
jgi:hypothetical protein